MTCWKKPMTVDDRARLPRFPASLARQLNGHCERPVAVAAQPRRRVKDREIP